MNPLIIQISLKNYKSISNNLFKNQLNHLLIKKNNNHNKKKIFYKKAKLKMICCKTIKNQFTKMFPTMSLIA